MAFSIKLVPDKIITCDDGEAVFGLITLGNFREHFTSALGYWSVDDYLQHWKQALDRIINEEPTSCLITSMLDPKTASFIFWWPMYRVEDFVFIQNQIFFLNQSQIKFGGKDPFSFVPARQVVNEDGLQVSEWSVPILDVKEFYTDLLSD
jgi:hypothetical protein